MKKIAFILFTLSIISLKSIGQTGKTDAQMTTEIKALADTFMNCLITKDSVKFYNLFNENPITLLRIYNNDGDININSTNSSINPDYFNDDKFGYYRSISNQNYSSVKKDSIVVELNDYAASAVFNYSFFKGRKKMSYGQISLGVMFKNSSWLVNRLIYTMVSDAEKK